MEENATKPEQFWKCIKNLFPTKPKYETTCTKFELDGKMISDKLQIANGFCNFFQTVASKFKRSCIPFKEFVWSTPNEKLLNVNSIFKFSHVSVPEVKKHLKQLKRKKAEGIDEIPNCILRDCAHELAPPIAHIINFSLKSAQIAEDLKTAKITPIFKDGEKSKYTNYRPISVLRIISKILERCVNNQLIRHLELHNTQQYGFRKKRSTESQRCYFLTRYIKQWIVRILQVPYSSISARHLTLFPTHQFWTSSQHMEFLEMKKRGLQITSFTEK